MDCLVTQLKGQISSETSLEKDGLVRRTMMEGQGQGPKVSSLKGKDSKKKPEANNCELKIRSQSGPRRKKDGFIYSKPLKKSGARALKKMVNGKSSFLPQIGCLDRPSVNDKRMHRSNEGVPISVTI